MRGELARLEKRRTRIDQPFESLARQELAAFDMTRARSLVAAERDLRDQLTQLGAELPVMRVIRTKAGGVGVELGSEYRHDYQRRACG